MKKFTRRNFIKTTASFMAACGITKITGCSSSTGPTPTVTKPVPMPTRPFGKTGFNVGIFSLGGQAALETPGQEDLSEQIINRALDLGVNYIDTSAYYGGALGEQGLSERNIGRVIKGRRQDVFVATKSLSRGYDGAMRDLEQSLQNLQTDYVDLWQIHNMRTQYDLNAILAPTGALSAFQQAKTEGSARFIGVSGHYDPGVLAGAIISADFDAVLMALNAADIHYKSFIQTTLPLAVERDMAIVAMKIPARGRIFREDGLTTMQQALGYTLTHPVSTAIIGCSSVVDVEENVKLAKKLEPFSDDEMRHIEELTASYYREGAWFKYEW
jgi:aryl-alcohol dehydrogenase-like predicted oxidoreductase